MEGRREGVGEEQGVSASAIEELEGRNLPRRQNMTEGPVLHSNSVSTERKGSGTRE